MDTQKTDANISALADGKQSTNWWEKIFGDERVYSLLEGGPNVELANRQVSFVAEVIGLRDGMRVLDVGCGRGWLSYGLAQMGAQVTGIDSSPLMARLCGDLSSKEPRFSFQHTDFRALSYEHAFDVVMCWGNTLGFSSRDADTDVLRRMVRALVPGGIILVDLHNTSWYQSHALGRTWRETEDAFLLSDVAFDQTERRLICRELIIPKAGGVHEEYPFLCLQYTPGEITDVLTSLGIEEIAFYGDGCASQTGPLFSREGYNERSHCMIASGRKKSHP